MYSMKVKQRSLQSHWFSSIQLTFLGVTAAVKANQLPPEEVSFTVTYCVFLIDTGPKTFQTHGQILSHIHILCLL